MAAKPSAPCTLRLSGELTVRTIADAHQKLVRACAKKSAILIDTSDVSEVDLTLVQLLEAARRSSIADGRRLALSPPPSGALRDALQRGGFLADDSPFWKGE